MQNDKYDSQVTEPKWHKHWQESGVYKWDAEESRENSYVIDTPPPTVSGFLHMGHIFSYTQTDFIARFQRMNGKNVFYPIGFDDNGLPTERLVEKVKGVRAGKMSRQDFIVLCQEVVKESEEEFRRLFKSVGISFDWDQEYQTISDNSRRLSQLSFLDLHRKGKAVRNYRETFWDPVDQTAIAQAEIVDKESQGFMNTVTVKTTDGQTLSFATTRPELLAACKAFMYHPEDERYKHLAGKRAIVPIFGQEVPLIADNDVVIDKGTGLVYCSTFGDIQDVIWFFKYHDLITDHRTDFIGHDGKMHMTPGYDDMYAKDAKAKIIEDLKALGLLTHQEPTKQVVKCAERSGAPLEILMTMQWFIKVLDIKEEIKAKAAECNWHPEYMKIRLDHWVDGLNQDWCISRQRFFGVPFPVWYSKRKGEEGKILVADADQLPVDPLVDLPNGYTREEVEPEIDVMDTWATSSISPQLNSRGISDEFFIDQKRHQNLFPADLRPQAHEIIRTWTFSTLVKSFYHSNSIPWKNIAISGWCLAADKTKMSKSKGNVVTPTELIIDRGADVVRYWASTSKLGVDIAYSEEMFKIGKKLVTKLWNASKFAALHLQHINGSPSTPAADANTVITQSMDLWVLARLQRAVDKATKSFIAYDYADARVAAEDFFWNDFCDNYLEIIKGRIYNEAPENQAARQSAIYTVHHCLMALFRLFAPFVPHICEELNESIFGVDSSVCERGAWPKLAAQYYDEQAEIEGSNATKILELVRKFKSSNNISLKTPLEYVKFTGCSLTKSSLEDLRAATGAVTITAEDTLKEISLADGKIAISTNL
ncbi:MAG: valine--tRNA ligase [Rickettsiales bacterium]